MIDMEVTYTFQLEGGHVERFELRFDPETMDYLGPVPASPPDWAGMEVERCSHCTIDVDYCPLALRLIKVIERFHERVSHEKANVVVEMEYRTISADTTVQRGLSSMLGLIIPTSGCPHTYWFRPMARFHLPFSGEDETIYRSTSMYMLAQYFRQRQGMDFDEDMSGLTRIYRDMEEVNLSLARRLRLASKADSSVNAVILLDFFAKTVPLVIEEKLEEVKGPFARYLKR
ncbi:hypothetical protein JCM12178A_12640 [Salidesulfovibrio brasiliensis]|nr:hypothetical protein [Salidesulfovibrio brasiliensis]